MAMRMPAPVEPARLQCVGADPLDALRDDLVGQRHGGRADAVHARRRRRRRCARPGASRTCSSEPTRTVTGAPRRASSRLTAAARPGAAAMVSELGGGAGDRCRCAPERRPRDRAERRGCEHETAHAGSRYWTRLASPAAAGQRWRGAGAPDRRARRSPRRPRRTPGRARRRPRATIARAAEHDDERRLAQADAVERDRARS